MTTTPWCRCWASLLEEMPSDQFKYLVLDEVSYIDAWDRGVKYLVDAGLLENTCLILTGSDLLLVQEARLRLPGRRGTADRVDFHLHPLSFAETLALKGLVPAAEQPRLLAATTPLAPDLVGLLLEAFDTYLAHGGFLRAINDLARHQRILPATLAVYSDWIRGDMGKRGKQEPYLREVLGAILKRYGTQVSWNALARDLSIDHPSTVSDYIQLLASLDVVFVQAALAEERLAAAPKKARKVVFKDPFIYHAVRSWLEPSSEPYETQILPLLASPEQTGPLVEACVAAHCARRVPTFYIKGKGEIDVAYVHRGRFWPVEIKWTGQLRPKSLKQVLKYPQAQIWSKTSGAAPIMGIEVGFLPLALMGLEGLVSP